MRGLCWALLQPPAGCAALLWRSRPGRVGPPWHTPPRAGAHILSGNVLQPTALDELLPGWREDEDCPIKTPVTADRFYLLTQRRALRLPTPPQMKNKGNYVVSLRWGGGLLLPPAGRLTGRVVASPQPRPACTP